MEELNLSLTARESGFVHVALVNLRNNFEYYLAMKRGRYDKDIDFDDYEKNIKEIGVIIEKVERMADEG